MKFKCIKCESEEETTIALVKDGIVLGCNNCREEFMLLIMPWDEYGTYLKAVEAFTGKTAEERKKEFMAKPSVRDMRHARRNE